MKKKILISIIITYYKKKQFINQTIQSILNQSYKNFELIFVYDDNDKDDLKYIKKVLHNVKRKKIIINSRNLGVAKSRNLAIKRSKGTYLAFIDSDDLWKKNKLELQLNYMIKNQYLYTHTSYSRSDSGKIVNSGKSTYRYPFVGFHCRIATPTVIVHKSLLEECNFDESIKVGEDTVLWLNISNITPLFGMNADLATVHIDKDTTASSSSLKIEAFFSINKAFRNRYFIRLVHLVYILIRRFFKTF